MNFRKTLSPSEICLIAANMIPLIGVVFWEWYVFDVMLLFWLENVIIGLFNILKMSAWTIRTGFYLAIPLIAFFALHYGGFTFGHFIFLMTLFGGVSPGEHLGTEFFMTRPEFQTWGFYMAVLGLFASHLFSFCVNFLGRGQIKQTNAFDLMFAPYGRVMMLHVTLLIGGVAAQILKQPVWAMILLVWLKIAFDLRAHRKSHAEKEDILAENLRKPAL